AESERMEVRGHHVGVEPLGLVEDERDRLSGAAQLARHELILRREPGARVGEQQQPIGLGDRTLGLGAHLRLDAARVPRGPAGVDDDAGNRTHPAEAVLPVARESGHVRYDGVARCGEHVEERRLADVRPADEGDHGQHGRGGRTRSGRSRVYWLSSRVGAGVSGTVLRSVAGTFLRSVAGARASGVTRNALTWPRSLTTTTVLPATTGA